MHLLPFEVIETELSADDDREFWRSALGILTDEFRERYDREAKDRDWIFRVGVCSHWIRPHQTRWTAAGGFAWPGGYDSFRPELDWVVTFSVRGRQWIRMKKFSAKKQVAFMAAIPARTARHRQAVIHTKWSISERPVFYGFRKLDGCWKCVAASDEESGGRINLT